MQFGCVILIRLHIPVSQPPVYGCIFAVLFPDYCKLFSWRYPIMTEKELYQQWLEHATEDADLQTELKGIAGDDAAISDRFYRALEFGTGGLRGVIGAGTYRMNLYKVRRATQGLMSSPLSKHPALPFPMTAVSNPMFSQKLPQKFLLQTAFAYTSIQN